MSELREMIVGFPKEKKGMPSHLQEYWNLRNRLHIIDGVILLQDEETMRSDLVDHFNRVLVPQSFRSETLHSLHAAHQGISSMIERARSSVYWPGITNDIISLRHLCGSCNRIAPSNPSAPPIEPCIPTSTFEAVACDFFHYMGRYYFVAADRLSGWTETQQIKVGTIESGSSGLCKALRRLSVTFGVPSEISSDGGPEFVARETGDFFKRWGVRHRQSSVSFPSSNGRAELAMKMTKRLLMNNVGPNGDLNSDKMVRALLTQRNTPDLGCRLSSAQVLFGRPLKDTLPIIKKDLMVFNNPQILKQWRDTWKLKEETMRSRYVKTTEKLNEHARPLPPLRHGDHVFIQNQSGRFPTKVELLSKPKEMTNMS